MDPSSSKASGSASKWSLSINTSGLPPNATSLSASASAPIRPSSRVSARPPSSASSIRPSASAPIRPSSSVSSRPSSSALSARPPSSASTRPSSRLTQRPGSRISHRPASRQSSRLLPEYKALVTQVTGLTAENDQENFHTAVDFVSKNLDQTTRPSGNADMFSVEKHVSGHVQKARINSHDLLATALETAYRRLKSQAQQNTDFDSEIKVSRLPDHLQLLLTLALPPSQETIRVAEDFLDQINNPRKAPPGLTWKDILAEEPFEGQHWEGAYGLPPGSTVEDWDTHSGGSTPSLSALEDSDDDLDDSLASSEILEPAQAESAPDAALKADPPHHRRVTYGHRQDVEELQARQYWRAEWRSDISTTRPFNIGDASTLGEVQVDSPEERAMLILVGPSMQRVLGKRATLTIAGPDREKYIYEHDAVREVLMGLQGRRNIMMTWVHSGSEGFSFVPNPSTRLLHLTAATQASILASFARTATTLEHLRRFVLAIYAKASKITPSGSSAAKPPHLINIYRRNTLTLEAFAAAVDFQVREFNSWCATKEEEICLAHAGIGPPLIVSLLSLEKAIRDKFSATFTMILDVLRGVVQRALRTPEILQEIWTFPELSMRVSSSTFTTLLLDSLLLAVQDHLSMGDIVTSNAMMRVFGDTAEPIWSMVGRWMKDGMPVREVVNIHETDGAATLDDEFFVEDNEMPIFDPDFWADGFVLKDCQEEESETRRTSVPTFLTHFAQNILDAGKAIGLLRALGASAVFDRTAEQNWMTGWRTFTALLESPPNPLDISNPTQGVAGSSGPRSLAVTSTDELSSVIYDELLFHTQSAQEMLQRVLVDDCDLWLHLSAMEDLFLMRRGDSMSRFIDVLFSRMDNRQAWSDFHFLNSAFRDVAEASPQKWIDPFLVRISHRGAKDKSITRTVRAIDGLFIEYAVPFPLTYIFGPRVMQVYSSIFSFIIQIRRAKNVLERILIRGAVANVPHAGSEMKVFYAIRSRLSWFVNTLLNFVATNVLHAQIANFHNAFRRAKSLNDMIQLHDEHLSKIEGRCLLQRNTSAFQRAIMSILDMTIYFSDCFVAFAGDTTHDISRQSILMMKRHRSRRARRQRKNVVGFSQSLREADGSSESDSDPDEDIIDSSAPEPSFSLAMSTISLEEESFGERLDKMSSELDALVRFIRRGVESLAAGSGEAASTFGIFAFALEDWDR